MEGKIAFVHVKKQLSRRCEVKVARIKVVA